MNDQTADLLIEIMKAMRKHGDSFSVRHTTDIEARIEAKYKPKKTIKAEPTNAYAAENILLREGLRVGIDLLKEIQAAKALKVNRKAKQLMSEFVTSADKLLRQTTVIP
jgi:hypothetical protein